MIPLHPTLRSRVASIQVIAQTGCEQRVLPAVGSVLGFQVRGRVRASEGLLAPAGVTGVQTSSRKYAYVGDTLSVLVRFTPQGGTCLGVPASELAGRSIALEDLLPAPRARALHERFVNAPDVQHAVEVVQEFLRSLPYVHDPRIARAAALLEAAHPAGPRVAAVAREVGLSERHLERRFLARLGLTPKRFASLRRFERSLQGLGRASSLTALSQAAGYYDQSHFIREFSRFAGAPPGSFLRDVR